MRTFFIESWLCPRCKKGFGAGKGKCSKCDYANDQAIDDIKDKNGIAQRYCEKVGAKSG